MKISWKCAGPSYTQHACSHMQIPIRLLRIHHLTEHGRQSLVQTFNHSLCLRVVRRRSDFLSAQKQSQTSRNNLEEKLRPWSVSSCLGAPLSITYPFKNALAMEAADWSGSGQAISQREKYSTPTKRSLFPLDVTRKGPKTSSATSLLIRGG